MQLEGMRGLACRLSQQSRSSGHEDWEVWTFVRNRMLYRSIMASSLFPRRRLRFLHVRFNIRDGLE
jgi:hypothetical protein